MASQFSDEYVDDAFDQSFESTVKEVKRPQLDTPSIKEEHSFKEESLPDEYSSQDSPEP